MSLTLPDDRRRQVAVQSSQLIRRILHRALPPFGSTATFVGQLSRLLAASFDPHLSFIPLLACEAAGGRVELAVPVVAAWQAERLAAKLVDDLMDGESAYSPSQAINLVTSLLFAAPLALEQLSNQALPLDRVHHLISALAETGLHACMGQPPEFSGQSAASPDDWLGVARAKSGEPTAWAAWAGGVVAGVSEDILAGLHEFGLHLGILLQIGDDFNGIWHHDGTGDLKGDQLNLALCYARWVTEASERNRLEMLMKAVRCGEWEAQTQVQDLLIEIGAQAYLLAAGAEHRQQALRPLRQFGEFYTPLAAIVDVVWPALSTAVAQSIENAKSA